MFVSAAAKSKVECTTALDTLGPRKFRADRFPDFSIGLLHPLRMTQPIRAETWIQIGEVLGRLAAKLAAQRIESAATPHTNVAARFPAGRLATRDAIAGGS